MVVGCATSQVLRGEEIPADLVFLSAMNDDPELRGMCHVQTAQLDGETNLKLRQSTPRVTATFGTDEDCKRFKGYVECEQPTEHFGKFTGKMLFSEEDAVRLRCCSPSCWSVMEALVFGYCDNSVHKTRMGAAASAEHMRCESEVRQRQSFERIMHTLCFRMFRSISATTTQLSCFSSFLL